MRMKSERRALQGEGGDFGVVGKERRKRKERAMEVARFLYPAKAAAGPCARFARCGRLRFPDAHLPSAPLLI